MTLFDSVRTSLSSLRVNLLRSFLTSLGIIIGVGAVIIMVAVGAGAESRVERLIQSIGANVIMVLPGAKRSRGVRMAAGSIITLTEEDAAAIARDVDGVNVAAPSVRGSAQVVHSNENWSTLIYGITPDYMIARNWTIGGGRMFGSHEVRNASKVAVIGQTLVDKLFAGGNPLGSTIRIKRVPFLVIGVLKAKGRTPWGRDQDDLIFTPLSTAKKRVLGGRKIKGNIVTAITLQAADGSVLDDVVADTTQLLRQRHKLKPGAPDDFSVRNIASYVNMRQESSRVMTLLLASVAAISLIVGGIGIMNIMLVSVTERTREIGVRMAVGARGRDVMVQFVIEAITLSLIGGLIGVGLGIGGTILISNLAGWPALIQPQAIALAVAFSAAVGVFFGFYPARKAARLDPIEALRYE